MKELIKSSGAGENQSVTAAVRDTPRMSSVEKTRLLEQYDYCEEDEYPHSYATNSLIPKLS